MGKNKLIFQSWKQQHWFPVNYFFIFKQNETFQFETSILYQPQFWFEKDNTAYSYEFTGCFCRVLWGGTGGSWGEESRGGQGDWLSGGIRSASGNWIKPNPPPIHTANYDQIYHWALSTHLSSWTQYQFHMCIHMGRATQQHTLPGLSARSSQQSADKSSVSAE